MWLSETACNNATLEVLIQEGIKYTILDPSQAEKIRKIGTSNWEDVIGGRVNPKLPYRYFSKKQFGYIDIFFYDGPLSKNLAFDDVVFDAKRLMDSIDSAKMNNYTEDQLIALAVDGETFGHHKHFTERTISFLLSEYAETRGYKIVNYGEYLALHEPQFEVMINEGNRGEGTSWSCVHGVGRWKKNCGCNTGGYDGWNQRWRRHLRNALNLLDSKLAVLFEIEGQKYFKNVWDARNDYLDVILTNDSKEFFAKHSVKKLKKAEMQTALYLLEMQKFAMFMFTSCGWFFSDISGIESQKVLEYAKRSIEMGEKVLGISLHDEFLDELEKAKSNKPEYKNGKEIFLKLNVNS
jgi:alpha-amylase/alpha-mannosidase (GH57 family)